VLGGGLVAGSVVLIGGDPGIGKSTILLQAAHNVAASRGTVLYVTGGGIGGTSQPSSGEALGWQERQIL